MLFLCGGLLCCLIHSRVWGDFNQQGRPQWGQQVLMLTIYTGKQLLVSICPDPLGHGKA